MLNKKLADLQKVECCKTCVAENCLLRCYGSSGFCTPRKCLPALRSKCEGYHDHKAESIHIHKVKL
jgi:hypothetical protein